MDYTRDMLTDRQGKEIDVGATVSLRLVITNIIPGADPVNLIAKPEKPWPGIPEDQRFSLAAAFIELVKPAPSAAADKTGVPTAAAAAPAAPVATPAAAALPQPQQPPQPWPQTYPGYR